MVRFVCVLSQSTIISLNYWCAILIAHQIVMAKHGGSCVHFSGISICGRTSRETVSHPQCPPLPTLCKISLPIYVIVTNKYWNWCRCIQRKDSAGVILTASWFNDINIGYRFHISTVCHSCCNNVMYFSKENLDISGSAWKNIMLAWHSCWHGLSWYWNYIYRARAVFAPCKHQQPDYSPVLAYYLWHILIFALYKYDSNKCIQ